MGQMGLYPNATPLVGPERMLTEQGGGTVEVTPDQIKTFIGTQGDLKTKDATIFTHSTLQPFKYVSTVVKLSDRLFVTITMNDSSGETADASIFGSYCMDGKDPAVPSNWATPYAIIIKDGTEKANANAATFIRSNGNVVIVFARLEADQVTWTFRQKVSTDSGLTFGATTALPMPSGIQYFTAKPDCGLVLDNGDWIIGSGQSLQDPPQGSQTGLYVGRIWKTTDQGANWATVNVSVAGNDGLVTEVGFFQLPNFSGTRGAVIMEYRTRNNIVGFAKFPDPSDLTTYVNVTSTLPQGNQPSSIHYYNEFKAAIAVVNGPVQTQVRKTLEIWISTDNKTSSDSDNLLSWVYKYNVFQDFNTEHIDSVTQIVLDGRLLVFYFTHYNDGTADSKIWSIPLSSVLGFDWTQAKQIELKSSLLNTFFRKLNEQTNYTFGQQRQDVVDAPDQGSNEAAWKIYIQTVGGPYTGRNAIFITNVSGTPYLKIYNPGGIGTALTNYADNAAAIAGGLAVNDFYQTSGTVKIVT